MAPHSLPVIDPHRSEFGFARTACACADCTRSCRHVPGYLVPADLERLRTGSAPGEDLVTWAQHSLLASPGALVMQRGRLGRIPTLVPARGPEGACLFLTGDGRCSVHATAPFGCAYFDSHMPGAEADRRSRRGLQAVLATWQTGDLYARLWLALHRAGLRAPAPEVCRQRLRNDRGPDKPP